MWLVAFLSDDEFRVLARVRRLREHEAFLPLYWTRDGAQKPLYPGYLFLRYHHRWPSALKIQGIARVLGEIVTEGETERFKAHMIADSFIERLRKRMEDGAVHLKDNKQPIDLDDGDEIVIMFGSATGWHAHVDNRKPKKGQIGIRLLDNGAPGPLTYVPLHYVRHHLAAPEGLSTAAKTA